MKLVYEWKDNPTPWPVRLYQHGRDSFRVQYGQDIKDRIPYGSAATELGAAIMHALACEGMLDNRERGER